VQRVTNQVIVNRVAGAGITLLITLFSAGPAFTQNASPASTKTETTSAPIVADVYVQTQAGVNVYSANSTGALAQVLGSPFADSGQMEGINSKYLLSVGTDDLHAYAIEANGAVGGQVSQIDTQSYGGSQCGNTDAAGAILDHSGQYFFVQLFGASYNGGENTTCAAWQTYKVASNGSLTFLSDDLLDYSTDSSAVDSSIPTISSADQFGFGSYGTEFAPEFAAFRRNGGGALEENTNFTAGSPTPDPSPSGDNNYFPTVMAADNAGHLAVVMIESFATPYPGPPAQLASFTIGSTGNLTTTNTYQNMPVLWGNPSETVATPSVIASSPAGNLLAVGGTAGIQFFHFNGGAPLTTLSPRLLTNVNFSQFAWDKSNHLYALSYGSNQLYVFNVTTTGYSQVAGSPYTVGKAYGVQGLIVVSK
jgi:hypothetical protein